jgi:hypothetical protein
MKLSTNNVSKELRWGICVEVKEVSHPQFDKRDFSKIWYGIWGPVREIVWNMVLDIGHNEVF